MMTVNLKVKKASGESEPFSEEKVRISLQRAGTPVELIDKILARLKDELYDGISTQEIYSHVFGLLRQMESHLASKYNLKQAIMELGPSGYPFEKFVAGILKVYGYETTVHQIIQGRCVSHEIDVIAKKDNEQMMIECKFHNQAGIKSDIKTALYTYARFLDVKEKQSFHQSWLVTNTKVTGEVISYAQCVGMKVTSWDYPEDFSLRFLIEKSGLHPVTSLGSLSVDDKKKFLERGLVFCKDIVESQINFLPAALAQKVKKEALKICQSEKKERR